MDNRGGVVRKSAARRRSYCPSTGTIRRIATKACLANKSSVSGDAKSTVDREHVPSDRAGEMRSQEQRAFANVVLGRKFIQR
jgi:hypothetical protein